MATSHTTRAAITVVLPEPAPAITTAGSRGAVIAANCWSLKVHSARIRSRSCSGVVMSRGVVSVVGLMVAVTRAPILTTCRGTTA